MICRSMSLSNLLKITVISFLLLSIPPSAQAADSKKLVVEGEEGIWFPVESGRKLFKDVSDLKLQKEKNKQLVKKLSIMDLNLSLFKDNLLLEKEVTKRALESARESEKRANAAEDKLNAWHRSPVIWFAVGVLVAAATTVTVTLVVD